MFPATTIRLKCFPFHFNTAKPSSSHTTTPPQNPPAPPPQDPHHLTQIPPQNKQLTPTFLPLLPQPSLAALYTPTTAHTISTFHLHYNTTTIYPTLPHLFPYFTGSRLAETLCGSTTIHTRTTKESHHHLALLKTKTLHIRRTDAKRENPKKI